MTTPARAAYSKELHLAVLALRRLDTMLAQAMRESIYTDAQTGGAWTARIRAIRDDLEAAIRQTEQEIQE